MMLWYFWPLPEGGAERSCRKLAETLCSRGAECTVLTSLSRPCLARRERLPGGARIERIPVFDRLLARRRPFPSAPQSGSPSLLAAGRNDTVASLLKSVNSLAFIAGANAFLRRHGREFDILHVHTTEWLAGYAAGWAAKLGIPVISKEATYPVLKDIEDYVPFGRHYADLRKRAFCVGMNPAMMEGFRQKGVPVASMEMIPNGVDIPAATARVDRNADVLYVANLTQKNEEKAFDVLIKTWALVSARAPGSRLLIAGGGNQTRLRELARECGCESSVEFLGFVEDMATQYAKAALFFLPSRVEGMSNALLEALSWGIPVVVSNIPANTSVVMDGKEGVVVRADDVSGFADAIVGLLGNTDERTRMGAAGRRLCEDRYSIQQVTTRYMSLYERLTRREAG